MSKILGLDLGTNSIGWALVDTNKAVIKGIGVRIFPMGVNLEKGHEVSKNATRREKRQTRRQTFRRKKRKRYIASVLQNQGMFPDIKNLDKELNKEKLNDDLKYFFAINPYKCRARAYMGEKLSLLEIGRILYQFAQRRGYKESLKGMDTEEGKLYEGKPKEGITGINLTKEKIAEHGTLGNYFYNEDPHKVRIRSRYTTRRMYLDEFEIIWENQKKFYPDILTEDLKQKLGDPEKGLLFYQRPLRSQKHLIGHCTFEPGKPRCPKSAIPFEEFRMYQFINTIKHGEDPLNDEERSIVIELFNSKDKFDFREIKKKLNLEGGTFNYEDDHKVVGNKTINNFRKIFGKKRWDGMNLKEMEDVWHIKLDADDKEWLTNYAKEKWQLDEKATEKFIKLKLIDDYANLSRKAIKSILPFLKKKYLYNEAVLLGGIMNAFGSTVWNEMPDNNRKTIEDTVIAYVGQKSEPGTEIDKIKSFLIRQFKFTDKQLAKLYHHSAAVKEGDVSEKLPEPENLRNPIVQQALFELKRVVNNIIDEYGKPDEIKIELARDLKSSKKIERKLNTKFQIMKKEMMKQRICWMNTERNTQETIFKKLFSGKSVIIPVLIPEKRLV